MILFLLKTVLKSVQYDDILLLFSVNITSIAGDDVWNDPRYRKKKIYDELFLKSVDCIASVSWLTAHTMAREYGLPFSKFRLMPNATDRIAPPLDRTPAGQRILAVCRHDAHDGGKNIDKLIQAMVYVSARETTAILEIAGDGILRSELEQLASHLGLERCVRFLGRLPDNQLREAYALRAFSRCRPPKRGLALFILRRGSLAFL
jgi:phosphatidylinositol alpha-1,6-mannosyltransferase